MLPNLLQRLYAFTVRIINIGVSDKLSFSEKKKTQIVNITVAAGFMPEVFFGTLNFLQGRTILVLVNAVLFIGGTLILIINSYQKFLAGRLILTFAASIVYAVAAIYYRNGAEYFLLANMAIVLVFFNDKRWLISICLLNCFLFIGIKIFLQNGFVYGTVPFSRIVFNIGWALAMMILSLWFFKIEQKTYQRQLEEKNNELEKANQTKEKIFSIIAHDLRSPVAQLKSSLELVNREYINAEQFHDITNKVSSQVDQLHNTLDNLLRWSLSQLQGITAKPEKTDLAPLLQHKLTLFSQKIEEKKISLQMENTEQKIWVDPDHLLLVLRNLLSNAIKYSYSGGTITIHCTAANDQVTIAISDRGTGMNELVKQTIFHSDTIISHPGTANEKGTGLGLKLCREFMEKNNGHISVESFESRGSTFFISLPQAT